eukprot:4267356-Prymnesium_polylepis.1
MSKLGAAAVAAHVAFWSKAVGGRTLSKVLIQDLLIAYFDGRGEALVDLPTDVDVDDVEDWRKEWQTIAKSAGIADEVDRDRLVKHLEKRAAGPSASKAKGVAAKALETLETHGVVLSAAVVSDLEKSLAMGEAGDALAQSTCCDCVAILFTGAVFEEGDRERWHRLKNALAPGGEGQIDICRFTSYTKLQNDSNCITLERALRSPQLWDAYYVDTIERLTAHGLPLASTALHKVVVQAKRQARTSEPRQRQYLRAFFFDEFRGLGFPQTIGVRSALATLDASAGGAWALPTTNTGFDRALAGLPPLVAAGQDVPEPFDLASLPSAPGSTAGSMMASSAGALSAQEMAAAMAPAVVSALTQQGLLGTTPPIAAPAAPGSGVACRFCQKSTCTGNCPRANRAFQILRDDEKAREAAKAAKAAAANAADKTEGQ